MKNRYLIGVLVFVMVTALGAAFYLDDGTSLKGAIVPPSVDLRIDNTDGPLSVTSGTRYRLSWTATSGSACRFDANSGSPQTVSAAGQRYLTADRNKTHILTCTKQKSSKSDSVTVNIAASSPSAP
ncbi:hypothetical protein HYV58_00280, partial [Candidatus Peregrinibacteria bacterium]|nr:hypothetical protein [Candidatus Peregrinibacteria bacterium]